MNGFEEWLVVLKDGWVVGVRLADGYGAANLPGGATAQSITRERIW